MKDWHSQIFVPPGFKFQLLLKSSNFQPLISLRLSSSVEVITRFLSRKKNCVQHLSAQKLYNKNSKFFLILHAFFSGGNVGKHRAGSNDWINAVCTEHKHCSSYNEQALNTLTLILSKLHCKQLVCKIAKCS